MQPTECSQSAQKTASRWHTLRGSFVSFFRSDVLGNVEVWYNTVASPASRDAFQTAVKQIRKVEPKGDAEMAGHKDSVCSHVAVHFANIYGTILSEDGRKQLATWALVASEADLEKVRLTFTAIQSTLNPMSETRESFPSKLPQLSSKMWHRKRIDWMSKKVHLQMQRSADNPMIGSHGGLYPSPQIAACSISSNCDGGARKGRGGDVRKSLIESSTDALETLRAKREAAANSLLSTTDSSGCVVYRRPGASENRQHASSRNQIIATFSANNTAGWQTTSRETIRDHSGLDLAKPTRVSPESHPSMSRVTASLGMVLPHPSMLSK